MKGYYHKNLASVKWHKMSFLKQMANIGSEVSRAYSWKNEGDREEMLNSFYRALELLDLSINDKKNQRHLSEILCLREVLSAQFWSSNSDSHLIKIDPLLIKNYFLPFAIASRA